MRRLAVELRPAVLDDFGLVAALERLIEGFAEQSEIRVDFHSALGELRLPTEVESTLYRVVQESLTNIVKHADAHNISVSLARRESTVAAVIEDDGVRVRPASRARGERRSHRHARAAGAARRATGDRVAARSRHYGSGRGAPLLSIRVLIVDDHAVVRSGLRLLLAAEKDIEPVGEAGTARDAVFQSRALKPDVILLDIVMPEQTGLEVLPQLKHENPDAKVLVLSMQDEPRYVREAFGAGASGYVLKDAADNEVVAAIREVAVGGRYVNPDLGARLVAADAEAARLAEEDPLSDREREVLRLLALGHTNQEIAKMLYISVRTAETHRAHIMQKLRLQTRADLVAYAIERGLLEAE